MMHAGLPPLLVRLFPPAVRARGDAYAASGAVTLMDPVPDAVLAVVHGSHSYLCDAVRNGSELVVRCSCPYAAAAGACKHLWAVFVVAGARGQLAPLMHQVRTVRLAPEEEDFDETAAVDDDPELGGGVSFGNGLRRRREQRPRAEEPAWASVLQRARQRATPDTTTGNWPADRRLVYLLDLAATRVSPEGLVVQLATERRQRDGSFARPKLLRTAVEDWEAVPDPADRFLVQMLRGARRANNWMSERETTVAGFVLTRAAFDTTVRLLCETGRFRIRRGPQDADARTLAYDGGPPWIFHLRLEPGQAAGTFALRGVLTRPGGEQPLEAPELLHSCGLLVAGDAIACFEHGGNSALLAELRSTGPLAVAGSDVPAVLGKLYELPRVPAVDLPSGINVTETSPEPVPVLSVALDPPRWGGAAHCRAQLAFDYDRVAVPHGRPGTTVFDEPRLRVIHRRAAAEADAHERLRTLGVRDEYDWTRHATVLTVPASRLAPLVETLVGEEWQVTLDGVRQRRPTNVRARVASGIDWFAIEGEVEFGDAVAGLPAVLKALRSGSRTVTLGDGSVARLPEAWRQRLAPLAAAAGFADEAGRFARSQTALLDALLASEPGTEMDATFARARAELQRFDRIAPGVEPPGFAGELREYQREALGWFGFLRQFALGGCLADDMGLGKTVQVLALLAGRRAEGAGPSLAVVPRSLVFNWMEEAARFAPGLRVLDHTGVERARGMLDPGDADLVLTTYGTLRQDAPLLREIDFDYVILDEAQAIKNAGTASAKAARLLRGRHRLALTGTPIENRLEELWSLFAFLNPGMLGGQAAFAAVVRRGVGAQSDGEAGRALLARALRPVILRRTKEQVAPELPQRTEHTLTVELEPAQRKVYQELLAHYRRALLPAVAERGIARSKLQILEALLRLRQAACHPALIDPARAKAPSAKLDALVPMLSDVIAEGHKALVFSQFTTFLALLRERLDAEGIAYEYLDGRTRDRQRRVEHFQSPQGPPVFLISLRAGGQGLNLTSADYVYLLDPWWNPAVEAQAIDRAHRIGQPRHVFATRLVAHDTVEEKILAMQQTKRELADAILGEDQGVLAKIGVEELNLLLG